MNMGDATNVNSFQARFDMLKPATAKAANVDVHSKEQQTANPTDLEDKALGSAPTVAGDNPRQVLISGTGLSQTGDLQTATQSVVDRSSWAITAEGEVNTVAYGDVIRAKRPIMVRGAGLQFSGTYYVEQVLHSFSGDGYTQHFSLKRNASGVQGNDNFQPNDAASA